MSNEELEKKYADKLNAWLMIQVTGQTSIGFFNRKKLTKEIGEHLDTLLNFEGVREAEKKAEEAAGTDEAEALRAKISALRMKEMREFAEFYIDLCLNSKAYSTTFFGTMPMSEGGTASRLAKDIDDVTRNIPARFNLEAQSSLLREVFLSAFVDKVPSGERILSELGIYH